MILHTGFGCLHMSISIADLLCILVLINLYCQVIHGHSMSLNEVILEDLTLPGLGELKGRWHGSLEASGGGNGDTMVYLPQFLRFIMYISKIQ